jgi:hypothetical protein
MDKIPAKNQERIIVNLFQSTIDTTKDFWNIESDVMHNWRYYFASHNPENLKTKKLKNRKAV